MNGIIIFLSECQAFSVFWEKAKYFAFHNLGFADKF